MRLTITNKSTALIASLAMLTIGGCGGGGSSSGGGGDGSDDSSSDSSVSLSGRVADGYLRGATVCLDLDADRSCDAGEPSTTSGAGGAFTIEGVSAAQSDTNAIVVEVPASAIDEDTNTNVGASYELTSAQGQHEFISPLTTLIETRSETTPGFDPEDLADTLALALGLDPETDLFADYIAQQNDLGYERAHQVAQGVAAVMAANYEDVRSDASAIGLDPAAYEPSIQRLVAKYAIDSLDTIIAAIEDADRTGSDYDPQAVASTIGSMDTTDLTEQLDRERLNSEQTVVAVRKMLEEGVNEFQVDGGSTYEQIRYVLDPDNAGKVRNRYVVYENSSWGAEQHEGGERKIYWHNDQWVDYTTKKDLDVSFMENGQARLRWGPSDEVIVQGSWVDISGKEIEQILSDSSYSGVTGLGGSIFKSGAKGVRFSTRSTEDVYTIDYVDPNAARCNHTFDVRGNCNVVTDRNDQPLQTLSDLLVGPAETGEFIETGTTGETIYLTLQGSAGDSSGVAVYKWESNGNKRYEVDWERRTFDNGTEVVVVEKPTSLRNVLSTSDTAYKMFAIRDGYVRDGDHIPEGSMDFESGVWLFNDAAMKDLLSSLETGLSPIYSP